MNKPFRTQLLKWVGNKQKYANEIIKYFPKYYGTYYEPFLGSGAILGTLSPDKAVGNDIYKPLMEIWNMLLSDSEELKKWYFDRMDLVSKHGKTEAYNIILENFNKKPNGADFIFITRACYGGVIRFRKNDGYMSTPCGTHNPISKESFSKRVDIWKKRVSGTVFLNENYNVVMEMAKENDLIYCDPPYIDNQKILYGAHDFSLNELFKEIKKCKDRGVYIALSIDGTKLSGNKICNIDIPDGIFEREIFIDLGKSMLKRFQASDDNTNMEDYKVKDRLLLTY